MDLDKVTVHFNDARFAGLFELTPADMAQVEYDARVVFVVVADMTLGSVKPTKDGDTKATWVANVSDAAIVRDDDLKQHLRGALNLSGLEPAFPSSIGTIEVRLPAPSINAEEEEEDDDEDKPTWKLSNDSREVLNDFLYPETDTSSTASADVTF